MRSLFVLALMCAALPRAAVPQTHIVVVTGLSGGPGYAATFNGWARAFIDAAEQRWGIPTAHIAYLAENVDTDPERIAGRSTSENIEMTLRELAGRADPDDQIFILLIGHGSTRDGEARFNLPGPDMTAADFAAALSEFSTQRIVFVNTASASGAFLSSLSAPNRTVITATRSGNERNRTIFARYFIEAFAREGADTDKDDRVSVLEAFNYARREVARAYEAEGRLLTEHALLDDNADGAGVAEPDALNSDGRLARAIFLSAGAPATADPRLGALYRERRELEARVSDLRLRKEEMDPEVYERALERLLVELALTTRRIREIEGTEP